MAIIAGQSEALRQVDFMQRHRLCRLGRQKVASEEASSTTGTIHPVPLGNTAVQEEATHRHQQDLESLAEVWEGWG